CALGCAPAAIKMQGDSQPTTHEARSGPVSRLDIDPTENAAEGASFLCPEIRNPRPDERLAPVTADGGWRLRAGFITGALITVSGLWWVGGWSSLVDLFSNGQTGEAALSTVVERIIGAESSGCPNIKNKRSSATGAGQFLDQTWLDLIRAHRPDLNRRSDREALELRRDAKLARELTMRLAGQNPAPPRARAFPVTRGAPYFSPFARGAGAGGLFLPP